MERESGAFAAWQNPLMTGAIVLTPVYNTPVDKLPKIVSCSENNTVALTTPGQYQINGNWKTSCLDGSFFRPTAAL